MRRRILASAFVSAVGAIAATAAFAANGGFHKSHLVPRIVMAGNEGVCSLSAAPHRKHTFRMEEIGWPSNIDVQIHISFANGDDYQHALKDNGIVHVDKHGFHKGPVWPCWPNQYGTDKVATYNVTAVQINSGKKHPPVAAATFQVVK